jgi:hypothetical protein
LKIEEINSNKEVNEIVMILIKELIKIPEMKIERMSDYENRDESRG